MPSARSINNSSIAIIGAGLVGGAILHEVILGWVRANGGASTLWQPSKVRPAEHLGLETIFFTATDEAGIAVQLQKLKDILGPLPEVRVTHQAPLVFIVRCGDTSLRIEAEPLDILPEGLTVANVDDETFRKQSAFHTYIERKQPRFLVIGANLASMMAYGIRFTQDQTLVLAWLLTTLKRGADTAGVEAVAVIGTTALGGQGTNSVWTEQSAREMDVQQTAKILAAYGILGLLDRASRDTESRVRYILLTPGSLLGCDQVGFGPVSYFSVPPGMSQAVEDVTRRHDFVVPLYEPVKVNLHHLSDEVIDWERQRAADPFLVGAKVKCGETGDTAPLQFACISHAFQMGFNADSYIAKIAIDELTGRATGYNQVPLGSGKIIEPAAQGQNERTWILQRLAALETQHGKRSCPVYPALGSARAQKEIVLASLVHALLAKQFGEATIQQLADYSAEVLANQLWEHLQTDQQLLAEITASIPIISPIGEIYTGPSLPYLGKGVVRTADLSELTDVARFGEFAAVGAVDLRPVRDVAGGNGKVYETGVGVLIDRARLIRDECVNRYQAASVDKCGTVLDARIRFWVALTSDSKTFFDPVLFVVQFLGGEQAYL
ncbi:hypothetical protein [Nitrosovibrio sp. Nv6]|uniref:hypothetical protein n=1 Tax=Nitrosovibrio sp. Nv6 TaxID=1855340 RepID=UPI0008AE9E23|nr:hypothetical protein [Nitrosovibrio sp. Nv6]SEO80653.1 hypothetical protein SAMN05216316_1153 [Nitrosovibrio sp. Nv6]